MATGITGYVKRNSDGEYLHSCGNQIAEKKSHKDALEHFVTSRGMSLSDYTIGFESTVIVSQWIKDMIETPAELWRRQISGTDSGMPRHMEDLITSNASLVIPAEMKKRYDEKVALRATKP
jgi:hypothetical protein